MFLFKGWDHLVNGAIVWGSMVLFALVFMNLCVEILSLCTLAALSSSKLILKEDGCLALVVHQRGRYYQAAGQAPMGKPVKIALAG